MFGKGGLAGLFPEITASAARPAEKGGELLSVLLTAPSFITISQNRKICNVDDNIANGFFAGKGYTGSSKREKSRNFRFYDEKYQ